MNGKLKLFEGIVGQEKAKTKLSFFHTSYLKTQIVPHIMFFAPKGNGKTTIAKEFAKGLVLFDENGKMVKHETKDTPKRKPFIEINCSGLKTVKQFFNTLVVPYMQDKSCTLLFDEAHNLPTCIEEALLTILNPTPENRTTFSLDEYTGEFDFRRHTFLFATTDIQTLKPALVDRLERVDLAEYTLEEMMKITQLCAKDVVFKEDVLEDIANVLRGNARAACKMAAHIVSYLRGDNTFYKDDWEDLCSIFGILPQGLNALELNALRHLVSTPQGTSLTALSAKTGLSRCALQQDVELYLQKMSLMEVGTQGRIATAKGQEYIQKLDKQLKTAAKPSRRKLANA